MHCKLIISLLLLNCFLGASLFHFNDPFYTYQSLRTLSAVTSQAADIGECVATTKAIAEGDDESWYQAWAATANRLNNEAKSSLAKGCFISAKCLFQRASNYYRNAEFLLHSNPNDPRILQTSRAARTAFLNAMKLEDTSVVAIEIPFESTTLPGYFCTTKSKEKRPLIIVQTGFDGTAEELYFIIGKAIVARGYNCLLFEGPGQGRVIREQGIPFRSNWETVITPVVDYAEKIPEVDSTKLALLGYSLGGYLVPRALAFEKRITLGIADGGVYDFHTVCTQEGPKDIEEALNSLQGSQEIDSALYQAMKSNARLRWIFSHGMYTFGAKSPSEWLRMTKLYTLQHVVKHINCNMLVIDSENDIGMRGQAKQLFDTLICPKEFLLFLANDGAGEHCQVGAYLFSAEKILNWVDTHF